MIHFSCSWIGRNRREVSILESNHKSVKNDVLNLPLEVLDIVWPEAAVATSLDGLTDADTAQTFQILGQFCILSAKPGKDSGKTLERQKEIAVGVGLISLCILRNIWSNVRQLGRMLAEFFQTLAESPESNCQSAKIRGFHVLESFKCATWILGTGKMAKKM